ncbi:hypothetical protein STEG23_010490 [Scotinomys teguina]
MKYSPTAAVLLQPPGSRNQESRHIRLSVLKAAVLVPPQGRDSHRKHQWGRYFQAKLEEPPTYSSHIWPSRIHSGHINPPPGCIRGPLMLKAFSLYSYADRFFSELLVNPSSPS